MDGQFAKVAKRDVSEYDQGARSGDDAVRGKEVNQSSRRRRSRITFARGWACPDPMITVLTSPQKALPRLLHRPLRQIHRLQRHPEPADQVRSRPLADVQPGTSPTASQAQIHTRDQAEAGRTRILHIRCSLLQHRLPMEGPRCRQTHHRGHHSVHSMLRVHVLSSRRTPRQGCGKCSVERATRRVSAGSSSPQHHGCPPPPPPDWSRYRSGGQSWTRSALRRPWCQCCAFRRGNRPRDPCRAE